MADNNERDSIEMVAHKQALKMALGLFSTIICFEVAIILGERIKTELMLFIIALVIPLICAVVIYLRFKNIHIHEEKYRRKIDYVQKKVEEDQYVPVESTSDEGFVSALSDKVDMLAVPSNNEDSIIVAISHNDNIIPVKELPKEQFEEEYNTIKE